jgi:hypothetical protein
MEDSSPSTTSKLTTNKKLLKDRANSCQEVLLKGNITNQKREDKSICDKMVPNPHEN